MGTEEIERLADAQKLVDDGVKTLDEKRPNWFLDVDLDTLDMRDPCLCVLGQVGAAMVSCHDPKNFSEEAAELYMSGYDMLTADWFDGRYWAVEQHGFEQPSNINVYYADLQKAWVRTIREKRGLPPLLDDMVDIP